MRKTLEPLESGDEEGCGYSWDHTLRAGDTECQECGAEVWDETDDDD